MSEAKYIMKYQEFPPSMHLADKIRCYWILEQKYFPTNLVPEPILPDGCPEIIFNLASPCYRCYPDKVELQPQTMIIGQMKHYVLIQPAKSLEIFGVRFHPTGFYDFIKQPLCDLTEKIADADSVLGKLGKEIEQRINEASTTLERISIFESYYEKQTSRSKHHPTLLKRVIQTISESGGQTQIEQIAQNVNINIKQLERIFNREIGLTPKSFSRIIRLQRILRHLNETPVKDWADLAYSFGYFDQAHFIKDFKNFSGTSPNSFARKTNQLTDFFIQE